MPSAPEPQLQKQSAGWAAWPARYSIPLSSFTRTIWVSDAARAIWNPRLQAVRRACRALDIESVKHGLRPAALIGVSAIRLQERKTDWELLGLSVRILDVGATARQRQKDDGRVVALQVAVGVHSSVQRLAKSFQQRDFVAVGMELGYPQCCSRFFETVCVQDRWRDTAWPMALAKHVSASVDAFSVAQDCAPETNILWRKLGIRACPHLPCETGCCDSIALARDLVAAGRDLGFRDEMDDLMEVLSWPVEWSALHGIAEIKTPILKIATETDATEVALRVRRVGTRYPSEGANGTQFPYDQKPRMRPTAANKPAFEEEAHLNGFASSAAMLQAHAPLVLAVRSRLGSGAGEIVDLGCGTAVLLGKIVAGSNLRPHGIDLRARAIEIARRNLPGWATQFHVGSIFDESPVWTRHFQVAVLSLRRLCETDESRAEALVARIRAHTHHLLVYAYAEGLRDFDVADIGRRFTLALGNVSEGQYVNWAWAFDTRR